MATTFQPVTDIDLANEYLAAKLLWHRRFRAGVAQQKWVPDTMYTTPINQDAWRIYQFAIQLED